MLISPSQILLEGNLPDTIDESILNPHITKAVIEMKKILTAEKYSQIEAMSHDNEDYIACASAEANLALAYAVPALNMATQGTGIVKNKGWDQSRSDLLNQDEVEKLCTRFRSIALDLLAPYIPQPGEFSEDKEDEIKGGDYKLMAL